MNVNIETNTTQQLTTELVDILARDLCGVRLTLSDSGIPVCNFTTTGINAVVNNTYEDSVDALRLKGINLTYTTAYIRFLDPEVVRVLTAKGVMQEGEGLTTAQAAQVKWGNEWFRNNTLISSFDEIRYFIGLLQQGAQGYPRTERTFQGATALESVDITNIVAVSYFEFADCPNLIRFHGKDGPVGVLNLESLQRYPSDRGMTYETATYAFYNCPGIQHITSLGSIPYIKLCMFSMCVNLEDVNLPLTCTGINNNAFDGDSKLTTINLSHVTYIGQSVFKNCSSLEYCDGSNSTQGELNLPNLTGTLGNNAFKGCSKLTSITSLGSITSIGSNAFENCTSLATINFPNTITSVGSNAFKGTAWLSAQSGLIYVGNCLHFAKGDVGTVINITPGTVSISDDCFFNGGTIVVTSNVTSITVPNSVKTIGSSAFRKLSDLTTLDLGEGVTTIARDALAYLSSLQSLRIPASLTSIATNEGPLRSAFALATVTVDASNIKYDSRDNCNAIIETSSNTLIVGCQNTVIPNSVTKIGDYSFNGCRGLASVTIGSSVTSIGSYAFNGCSSLTSINIPEGVTSIGSYAFRECSGLTAVTIGNSVTNIGGSAFKDCKSLGSITIPNSVTSIAGRAFDFTGIDTSNPDAICLSGGITFGTGLTKIEQQTFMRAKFTSLDLPANITTIANYAIDTCVQLQSITMRGVTSIGNYAFRGSALTSITIETYSVPTISGTSFKNDNGQYINNGNFTIFVPSNLLSSYQTAPNWSTLYNDGKIQAIST